VAWDREILPALATALILKVWPEILGSVSRAQRSTLGRDLHIELTPAA